jgi:hypothetical protein
MKPHGGLHRWCTHEEGEKCPKATRGRSKTAAKRQLVRDADHDEPAARLTTRPPGEPGEGG